jgi:hypothetical protein
VRCHLPPSWGTAVLIASCVGLLAAPAGASEEPADLTAPSGRAACHITFTVAAAISFGGAGAPPSAPVGPNDVVAALTPVLRACAERYPARPARECLTTGISPRTGLPVKVPDPLGVGSEQAEAVATAAEPLGLALAGPLRDFFVAALACKEPPPASDAEDADQVADAAGASPEERIPPARGATLGAGGAAVAPMEPKHAELRGPSSAASLSRLASRVPTSLRGAALVASVVGVVGLALLLRRQLAPRRRRSLLDASATAR